jgi:hypothetical protein
MAVCRLFGRSGCLVHNFQGPVTVRESAGVFPQTPPPSGRLAFVVPFTSHIYHVHRTHTVPRLASLPPEPLAFASPAGPSRRQFLSARAARASKQLNHSRYARSLPGAAPPHPRLD